MPRVRLEVQPLALAGHERQRFKELNSVQGKMAASLLRVVRLTAEEPSGCYKRRNRAAGSICKMSGLWNYQWFRHSIDWYKHLLRPRNKDSWSPRLLHLRGMRLQERRASFLGNSSVNGSWLASRMDTRNIGGAPCTRWHDGIHFAERIYDDLLCSCWVDSPPDVEH